MSMRMRKKRNFEARMQACEHLLLARGANGILNMKEAAENFRALVDMEKTFNNSNPVALEIGCGKGGFVLRLAKENPNVNYLALEKMSNVILTPLEETVKEGIENVRFLNIRAECLPCYIPEQSISVIYLNFSTPLPKLGYASQRLTHRNFLEKYKKLLVKGGKIIQKRIIGISSISRWTNTACVGLNLKTWITICTKTATLPIMLSPNTNKNG
ncbi:MAG: methyltransferase domain-containing protein [Clostridia bacterium]|nr:methyltransferase domain-containing protein [Clostridia bacterium]